MASTPYDGTLNLDFGMAVASTKYRIFALRSQSPEKAKIVAEGVTNWGSSSDNVQEGIETICIDSPAESFKIGEEAQASNGELVRNLKAKACIQKRTLQSLNTTASSYGPDERRCR